MLLIDVPFTVVKVPDTAGAVRILNVLPTVGTNQPVHWPKAGVAPEPASISSALAAERTVLMVKLLIPAVTCFIEFLLSKLFPESQPATWTFDACTFPVTSPALEVVSAPPAVIWGPLSV